MFSYLSRLLHKFLRPTQASKPYYICHDTYEYTLGTNRFGNYCVPIASSHRPAAKMVLANEIYEEGTIELMLAQHGNGDVVQAGAYFGDFLPAVSKNISNAAKVWSFEPNPENFFCADKTLQFNNIKNVVLHNCGLGEATTRLPLQIWDSAGQALGGGSQIVSWNTSDLDLAETNIVKLDDVIPPERQVSIIQLDVEGYELKALKGAYRTIRSKRPLLILEILPESQLVVDSWFQKNILGLGYARLADVHGNAVFKCP